MGVDIHYRILYNGRDVSSDFSSLLESITYTEKLERKASEVEFVLYNQDRRFIADWLPKTNDSLEISLGDSQSMLDCGTFYIDDLEFSGDRSSGDTVTIRAVSTPPDKLYTSHSKTSYKPTPVIDIIQKIATDLDLKVKGEIKGTYSGNHKGTSLGFIDYLAKRFGCIMKVENETIVLYPLEKVKTGAYELDLQKGKEKSYNISDKALGKFSSCTCRWFDSTSKKIVQGSFTLQGKGSKASIWQESKDSKEAENNAKNWLADKNKQAEEISLSLVGDVRVRAGIKMKLVGFGAYSKSYYIDAATHSISKSEGYSTSVELKL